MEYPCHIEIIREDGEVLGEIRITEDKKGLCLKRISFISTLRRTVTSGQAETIQSLIKKRDWAGLYSIDRELNPWYCPSCRKMFSGDEWRTLDIFDDDGWHDSIRGMCPQGHQRMLED